MILGQNFKLVASLCMDKIDLELKTKFIFFKDFIQTRH